MTGKRRRYRDRINVPSADRTTYSPDWRERHGNRKRKALSDEQKAGLAFTAIGGWLRVSNEGHHWQIRFLKGKPRLVDWWPSSAKLVIDQHWRSGIHVHRWQDVFRVLRKLRMGEALKQ